MCSLPRLLLFGLLAFLVGSVAFFRVPGNGLYERGCQLKDGVLDGIGQLLISEAGRRGSPEAQKFLSQSGDAEGRRFWLERLARGGDSAARQELALLLEERGDAAGSRYWYRLLGEAGDLKSQWKLVGLYHQHRARQLYWARKAAEQGLPEAQQTLGLLLLGLDQPQEALGWLKKAADAGLIEAQRQTALLLEKNSPAEAANYWKAAAQTGDAQSQLHLGILFVDRLDKSQEGLAWLLKAATQRLPEAQKRVALARLQQGALEDAASYFEMAATQGDKEAQLRLGLLLAGATNKQKPALNWLQKAADFPEAQLALGLMLMKEGNRDVEAELWLRRAADLGIAKAQLALATLLIRKSATPAPESLALVQKAAERGLPDAKYLHAMLLQENTRGPHTEQQVRRLLKEAALGGSTPAQIRLAQMMVSVGEPQKAMELYLMAAEKGEREACSQVGMLYLQRGQTAEAEHWLKRAAQKGDAVAANNLGMLLATKGAAERDNALVWLRQAASSGMAAGQKNLARTLLDGGDPKQTVEALQWMRRAALQGDKKAQLDAAQMAARPLVGERDIAGAVKLLRMALSSELHGLNCWQANGPGAGSLGFKSTQFLPSPFWISSKESRFRRSLVCASLERGDYERAVALCRAGIKERDPFCSLALATCYVMGEGVRRDPMAALGCAFAAEKMPGICDFQLVSAVSEVLRSQLDEMQVAGARQFARQTGSL